MRVTLIAAVDKNGAIGRENGLPWHIPGDLRHFKSTTLGHALIMGRKTYDSVGSALPGRRTIVLTRQQGFEAPGIEVVHTPIEALRKAASEQEVFIAGGAQIYTLFLDVATRLLLTEIDESFEGDTYFPSFSRRVWSEKSRKEHPVGPDNPIGFSIVEYRRLQGQFPSQETH